MSKLFNVAENNITYHLQNIFKTEELEENRTTQKIRVVQNERTRKVSREVTFYSLDAIIAVGYRVNSKEATDFRIWAINTLKNNGKIQKEIADKLALDEYKKYRIVQDKSYISDFDELVAETKNLN